MITTQSATYRTLQHNLAKTSSNLNSLYLQAATGKKLNKPSDDPSAILPVIEARSRIGSSDRYIENIAEVQDGLDIQDGLLENAENILVRAKEISIAGANGTLSAEDLQTMAEEVALLQEELLDVANVQVDGKYLFAGFADRTPPFGGDPVAYGGTGDHKYVESGPGQTVQTNLTGEEVFGSPTDIFKVLADLESALAAGDHDGVGELLGELDASAEQVRGKRASMGNINSRLDDAASMMEDTKLQMQVTLSRYEDADLVEVLSELSEAETAFEAALSVSAKVSELSILDYL